MIPDAEAILSRYIREHPAVTALEASIVPRNPTKTDKPWVRVTQHDAKAVGRSRTDHLIEWFGTFDCYAGQGDTEEATPQETASVLTRTVRAALLELHDTDPIGASVTGVEIISCPRLPDPAFEPAMEHFALTVNVWMHP